MSVGMKKGLGSPQNNKTSAKAAMPKRPFFQCVRTLDLLAILSIRIRPQLNTVPLINR